MSFKNCFGNYLAFGHSIITVLPVCAYGRQFMTVLAKHMSDCRRRKTLIIFRLQDVHALHRKWLDISPEIITPIVLVTFTPRLYLTQWPQRQRGRYSGISFESVNMAFQLLFGCYSAVNRLLFCCYMFDQFEMELPLGRILVKEDLMRKLSESKKENRLNPHFRSAGSVYRALRK